MTMVTQIPVIVENPLSTCGCRKLQLDEMGDHLCTWTQHVTKSRGRYCGDIELVAYLVTEVGPVSLVLDLRITHVSPMTVSEVSLTLLWMDTYITLMI
jgi:hypothetical protein